MAIKVRDDGSWVAEVNNPKSGLDRIYGGYRSLVPTEAPIADNELEWYRSRGLVQTHMVSEVEQYKYFHEWCGAMTNGLLGELPQATYESRITLENWLRFISGMPSPYQATWP